MALFRKKTRPPRRALIVSNDTPFEFVEAYKSMRTNLQFTAVNSSIKKLVITSSVPQEGKTTVAVNLAITLAENGSKVLLVDADLRKPQVHKYLNIDTSVSGGLTTVIAGIHPLETSIVHFSDLEIYVLPSGPIPPNPAEILGSVKMRELIDTLSQQYDYIVFDTPPVSVVTDAAVLSTMTDGVVLVVRQNMTTFELATRSKENLQKVNANILGCILNALDADNVNKSYKYYHYKKYQYRYGYYSK